MRFTQIIDGDRVFPRDPANHKIRCCDCGLVHRISFEIVKEKGKKPRVAFIVHRDPRATGAARRARKYRHVRAALKK